MKKRKPGNSRKKLPPMRGGQIVPVNSLDTAIYVNMRINGTTINAINTSNPLVKSVATATPGSIILSVDPSLSTLKDYTIFGYDRTSLKWMEIPIMNLDMGGNTVALYGNVPGLYNNVPSVALRKQSQYGAQATSLEVSIPVPVTTYGNIMQFVNMSDSIFNSSIYGSSDLISTVVSVGDPCSIIADSAGNLYMACAYWKAQINKIIKFTASTRVSTTIAGTGENKSGASPDGIAINTPLISPAGVAIDPAGNVYFAEWSANMVRRINSDGTTTTITGSGYSAYTGDGSAAIYAQINNPFSIAFDSVGNLYIADTGNHAIRKITAINGAITSASIIITIVGTGVAGSSGDGGLATAAKLSSPQGVFIDSAGNVYISDSGNNVIRKITATTGIISTIAGSGTATYRTGTPNLEEFVDARTANIYSPNGLILDSRGNLYISDAGNNIIRKVTPDGTIYTIAGTPGISGATGDGISARTATLNLPQGLALDSVGNLYICDRANALIRKVFVNNSVITPFVNKLQIAVTLNLPQGVAVDSAGNVYISDTSNHVIRKITAINGAITSASTTTTFAGTLATPGSTGDGGLATNASLKFPSKIRLDSAGNLYIVDTNNHKIRKVTASTGFISTVAGTGTASTSSTAANGDGAAATAATLWSPQDVAFDSLGNIYIADAINNRIRKVTISTGFISTVAGTGLTAFSGDGGLATAANLWFPQGVAIDSAGNLYIADTSNYRIRKVTTSTGIITTIAGTDPGAGYSGDGGLATNAQIWNPYSMAFDSAGNLYFADYAAKVIRKITTDGIITTIAGNFQNTGINADYGVATAINIRGPNSITFDSFGNLYIAETDNSAIRKIFGLQTSNYYNASIKLTFSSTYTTVNTQETGWVPTAVPGLALWLNANEPGDNASSGNTNMPLTKWTDRSGNNNHAFGGSTPPIYLGPSKGIYFDGINTTYLSGNIGSVSQYMYSFIVARSNYNAPAAARLLSLSQPNADDNSSNAYMGVSASSNTAATPSTKTLVIGLDSQASPTTSRLIYNNTLITKTPTVSAANIGAGWNQCVCTPAWIFGACTSIAYNGFMFVAVGDDGTNGLIYYSYDGIVWTAATQNVTAPRTSIFYRAATASTTVPTATATLNGNGGISVVIYTGSLWLCGGRSSSNTSANGDTPGLAYSYDGINWYEITNLPFTGRGDCVRSISTNGNLILLAGHLLPCLNYSYDGIKWYNSPASAISAVKLNGTLPFTGAKCVTWSKILNMWMIGGDGGTPDPANLSVDPSFKMKFLTSLDGFVWIPPDDSSFAVNTTYSQWIFPTAANGKYIVHRIVENSFYGVDGTSDFTVTGSISGTVLTVTVLTGGNSAVGVKIGSVINYNSGAYYGVVLSYGTASPTNPLGTYNLDPFYGTIPTAVTNVSIAITCRYYVNIMSPIGYSNSGGNLSGTGGGYMLYSTAPYPQTYNTYNVLGGTTSASIPWTIGSAEYRSSYTFINITSGPNSACTLLGIAGAGTGNYLYYNTYSSKAPTLVTSTLITAAVNAIVDNTNYNINIAANTHINSIKTTATTPDTNNTKPYLITAATNGKNTYVTINGSQTVSTKDSASNFNISTYMIGKNNGSSFNNYAGYIYEILTFNKYLTPVARSVIEGYLAWKWAINGLLPASHPFSLNAPTVYSILKQIPLYFDDMKPFLWLDAQDPYGNSPPPADRTLVGRWFDKSGNGNHAVSPPGSEPMFRTHVVKAGGIQFNRYPYMSMGLVPIGTPTITFTTGSVLTGTVSTTGQWTGGFGGFALDSSSSIVACADNAGFVYMGITRSSSTKTLQVIQYDETNIQTRLLYSIIATAGLTTINCITVGRTTGNIYVAFYDSTTNINQRVLILTPSALPITSNTTYTARTVTLQDPAGLSFNGTNSTGISDICGLVTDENENLYAVSMATFNKWYRFPISSLTVATTWRSDMTYTVTSALTVPASTQLKNINAAYSSKDKSISFCLPSTTTSTSAIITRAVLYLTMSGTNTFQHIGIVPGQTVNTAIRSSDGLFNASLTAADTTGNAITSYANDAYTWIYDPIGGYLFGAVDSSPRIKRIDIKTRQVTTIAGAVNMPYGSSATSTPVLRERFPVVTEASTVYDSPLLTNSTIPGPYTTYSQILNPLFVGSNGGYLGTHVTSVSYGDNALYNRAMNLTNLRATPSCMTGPMNISGSTVSVFVVYINTNMSKSLLPHSDGWQTPLLSLSSNTDHVTFIGSITGTVLTVSSIIAGTIQLGATLNTPLGGFISALVSGTINTAGSTYNISISQTVAAGTTMSASNGIDRTNTTMAGTNGASLGLDALSNSYISMYTSRTGGAGYSSTNVYRNNITNASTNSTSGVGSWPANGFDTSTSILPDMLFYSSNSSGISSKLNGGTISTTTGSFTAPFDISSFGLGIQPPNAARKDALLPNYFFDGTVCEVLVYENDFTTLANSRRLTMIEGYLAWKWGLQSKLPVAHIFKNAPPNNFYATPSAITINTTPVNLTDTSATISWSGGDAAQGYSYTVTASGVSAGTITDNGLASKSVTVTGLTKSTTYTIGITAHGTVTSTAQATFSFTTKQLTFTPFVGGSDKYNGYFPDAVGSAAGISYNHTIAIDPSGNLYVADTYNYSCKMRVISPAGAVVTSNVTIKSSAAGATCPTTLYSTIVINRKNGYLYINTAQGNILLAIPSQYPLIWTGNTHSTTWTVSTFVSAIASTPPATINLSVPTYTTRPDLAIDNSGNIYFISGSVIKKITVSSNTVTDIALDGASWGWTTPPMALAIDANNTIYAMNGYTGKNYVYVIYADNSRETIFKNSQNESDGSYTTAEAAFEFGSRTNMAADLSTGLIYILVSHWMLRVIDPVSKTVRTILTTDGSNGGFANITPAITNTGVNKSISFPAGAAASTAGIDLSAGGLAIDTNGVVYIGGRFIGKVGMA